MAGCRARRWVCLGVFDTSHPFTVHDLCHSEAIHRNWTQEAFNDLLAWSRYIWGNGIGALQDTTLQPARVGCFEWHSGSHHEVKQDAQRPNICILTNVTFVFEQLWGCVRWRATERVKDIAGAAGRAETKVTHFNAEGAGVEYVLSLQVPVHNITVMLGREKREKCLSLRLHLVFLQQHQKVK